MSSVIYGCIQKEVEDDTLIFVMECRAVNEHHKAMMVCKTDKPWDFINKSIQEVEFKLYDSLKQELKNYRISPEQVIHDLVQTYVAPRRVFSARYDRNLHSEYIKSCFINSPYLYALSESMVYANHNLGFGKYVYCDDTERAWFR